MSLHIDARTDLSLLDLCRLRERGEHVLKTPHVGNQYPNNLAMAMLGIPIMCVDRTIGELDQNFHPHCVVHAGSAFRIAAGDRLTTHTAVTVPHPRFGQYFPLGGNVAEGHMRALRDAFPSAPIETQTECLTRQGEEVLAFLEVLTRFRPTTWKRFVRSDGKVDHRFPPRSWAQVRIEGIHGVELVGGAGWIIPNAWAILWDVVSAGRQGKTEAHELSGPDMVRYIGKLTCEIDRAYSVVRNGLAAWQLPEHLTCHIVPVADMRLVVAEGRRNALERLVEAYWKFQSVSKGWSERIQARSGAARSEEIGRVSQERDRETNLLCEAALTVPEIFYQIERANFLSQYDLLTGTRLYVHPWGLEAKVSEVSRMMGHLTASMEKTRKKRERQEALAQ